MAGEGVERRARIDTETVRGLLLVNGGGAVALLAFLPTALGTPRLNALARPVILALGLYVVGLSFALAHNHLRRRCSLAHEQGRPKARLLGRWELWEPGVCLWSWGLMYASWAAFVAGGLLVCFGAWRVL